MKHLDNSHETVLVVDFGAQYAQLIARRVREARVYSEIVPNTISADEIALRQPAALIFSGGPKSVHTEGAPSIDPGVYSLGIPRNFDSQVTSQVFCPTTSKLTHQFGCLTSTLFHSHLKALQ